MVGQYQKTVDTNMGAGIVVIGLACLIIGETVVGRGGIGRGILAVMAGSVVYRFIYAAVLNTRIVPIECLKLVTALVVALAIAAPAIKSGVMFQKRRLAAGTKGGRADMLRIEHISKTFNPGTVNEKTALSDLSLHLKPGDFASIIGSNGAGKSTLLGAIAGSFTVDSGSIALDGRDITFTPDHRRSVVIGRLFQDPLRGTAPSMTIEENLALAYLRSTKERTSPFSRIGKKIRSSSRKS